MHQDLIDLVQLGTIAGSVLIGFGVCVFLEVIFGGRQKRRNATHRKA